MLVSTKYWYELTIGLHTFPLSWTCIPKILWYLEWDIGEGTGDPLQYSCLETPMDGGAWWAAVHGVAKSQTRLTDFTFTFHFPALEKEMATHSSVLAWRIPGTGEPGGPPSMGSHRVGHYWSDLAAAAAAACNKSKYFCSWFLNPQKFLFYLKIGKLEVSSHIVLDPALNTCSVSVTVLTLEVRMWRRGCWKGPSGSS